MRAKNKNNVIEYIYILLLFILIMIIYIILYIIYLYYKGFISILYKFP